MKVTELHAGVDDATYIHMERYVNDGSPTGFTEIHKTSEGTNPFTGAERFPLLEFNDGDLETVLLGDHQPYLRGAVNFAHPDSISSPVLHAAGRVLQESHFKVSPVAGGRTMILRDGNVGSGYLKLTYDVSRIGRVDRQLTLKHCVSSLEVSRALKQAMDVGLLSSQTALLLETAARVTMLPSTDGAYEWGTIFRERLPYPRPESHYSMVPGFSLFGRDRKNPSDKPLIVQLIEQGGYDAKEYLFDLIKMTVDCYWSIVNACAMHIECHGQNCFFEVAPDLRIARIIVKDMDSVEKDLPLARHLGIEQKWESYPYMCMTEDIYYYPIRASYMYDFKLGEYLLSPLISCVSLAFGLDVVEFDRQIREYVQQTHLSGLPPAYFPEDGCWYDCDNTERTPGTRRQYFPHPNPRFR
jgi:hypothetical protein